MKVRYYGFMHHGSSVDMKQISSLIELDYGFNIEVQKMEIDPLPPITCPECGGILIYQGSIIPSKIETAASG